MDISGFMPERKKKGERKVKISGTIKPEQEQWINKKIKKKINQEAIKNIARMPKLKQLKQANFKEFEK